MPPTTNPATPYSPFLRKTGAQEALTLLREHRVDVHATTGAFVERQPLHWCAYWNWPSVAQELLAQGAKVDALGSGRETALWIATSSGGGYPAMVRLLLDAGADMELKNEDGVSVWESAQTNCANDVVGLLQAHRVTQEQALLRATLTESSLPVVAAPSVQRPRL